VFETIFAKPFVRHSVVTDIFIILCLLKLRMSFRRG
jgi:hypothetical protein